jgi:hypothetical protein
VWKSKSEVNLLSLHFGSVATTHHGQLNKRNMKKERRMTDSLVGNSYERI